MTEQLSQELNNKILEEIAMPHQIEGSLFVDYNELVEILNSLTDEPKAGVTFSDGEFVPIEDETIMQWIAEQIEED